VLLGLCLDPIGANKRLYTFPNIGLALGDRA